MIKLVIFDLDGCFTDGSLHELVLNAKDTYGLKKLNDKDVKTAIISRVQNKIDDKFLNERIDYIYTHVEDKIEQCDALLEQLGINYNEVAFIGDDEPDLKLLNMVKISGCPNDAMDAVKDQVKFVSRFKGGKGAVREFSDYVLSFNDRYTKPIVAVVGVRAGSQRTKNKNTRDFGRSENLLDKKLNILNSVDEIDKVIVSSDSDEYLEIASKYDKVELDKRSDYYASSKISGKQLYEYLAGLIPDNSVFMYSPVVSPFLSKNDYKRLIKEWKKDINYDSVVSAHELKEFIWYENEALNYDFDNAPNSQDLPEYKVPTLGICLIEKETMLQTKNVIGKKPLMLDVDKLKSIDIDDNYDFAIAKLLNENYILDMNFLKKYLEKGDVKLLDCSPRDGGYRNNWAFTDEEITTMYRAISDAGIEYFEVGFRSPKVDGKGKWFYSTDDDIEMVQKSYQGKTPAKIAVMFKYGEYDLTDISEDSPIDMYRILIKSRDYNQEHNDFIIDTVRRINAIGKKATINIPYGHILNDELNELIVALYESKAEVDVFYIADTFGSMSEKLVIESFNTLYKMIKPYDRDPVFGFHSHNNNNDALYRSLYAIDKFHFVKYVDACLYGIGRGIGNLKTEDILLKMNEIYSKEYNLIPVYEYIYNNFEREKVVYKMAADYMVHPNKAMEIIDKNLNFKDSLNLILAESQHLDDSQEVYRKSKAYYKLMEL